jgi:hypothetical protein
MAKKLNGDRVHNETHPTGENRRLPERRSSADSAATARKLEIIR